MSLHTNNIALLYNFFWYNTKALKIEVFSININDQLADQFTRELQEGNFELERKDIMKW